MKNYYELQWQPVLYQRAKQNLDAEQEAKERFSDVDAPTGEEEFRVWCLLNLRQYYSITVASSVRLLTHYNYNTVRDELLQKLLAIPPRDATTREAFSSEYKAWFVAIRAMKMFAFASACHPDNRMRCRDLLLKHIPLLPVDAHCALYQAWLKAGTSADYAVALGASIISLKSLQGKGVDAAGGNELRDLLNELDNEHQSTRQNLLGELQGELRSAGMEALDQWLPHEGLRKLRNRIDGRMRSELKRRRKQKKVQSLSDPIGENERLTVENTLVDPDQNVELIMQERESLLEMRGRILTILQRVAKLSVAELQAYRLREGEGKEYHEIAVEMDCKIGTVAQLLHRARKKIAKMKVDQKI